MKNKRELKVQLIRCLYMIHGGLNHIVGQTSFYVGTRNSEVRMEILFDTICKNFTLSSLECGYEFYI